MPESFTVVGSSIASLAAALQAARRGHHVSLYVDPRRIGGSFSGIRKGDRTLDLGCRLLELDYEASPARPISAFDPEHDNHRPFIAAVASFIDGVLQGDIRSACEPEMLIAGHRTRCVLMTVDLSDLPAALSVQDQAVVRQQVRHILEAAPAVASKPRQTLRAASLAQHGPRLHELLIEAVCAKQHVAWDTVLAADRRKLWAALFEPRTVLEAFSGGPIGFRPHRPFATTRSGTLNSFVSRLYQAVLERDQILVVPAGPMQKLSCHRSGMTEFTFDGLSITAPSRQCVIGESPDQVFNAAGHVYQPERMTSSIVWVDVAEHGLDRPLSTLTVCDPEVPALRISDVGATDGEHCLAVEFGHRPPCPDIAVAALRQAGVVRSGAAVELVHQVTGKAQIAPTPENRRKFEDARTCLSGFQGVLLGGLRRFLFDGLNDQITEALFFGATRC